LRDPTKSPIYQEKLLREKQAQLYLQQQQQEHEKKLKEETHNSE